MQAVLWLKVLILALLMFTGMGKVLAVTLAEVQERFAQNPVVSARFVQERSIKGMSRPLTTAGTMLMSREHGIVWEQVKPFALSTIITPDKMIQVSGKKTQVITREEQPQLFNLTGIIKAVLTQDQKTLEQNFSYNFTPLDSAATGTDGGTGGGNWQLTLTPVKEPLNRIFEQIVITGTTVVTKVILKDRQGDTTNITFTDHETGTALSPVQLQKFNP